MVRWSDQRELALKFMEYVTSPKAQKMIVAGSEFPANPDVPVADHIRDWVNVKTDPIDVQRAGPLLEDAIALMLSVGWN